MSASRFDNLSLRAVCRTIGANHMREMYCTTEDSGATDCFNLGSHK
jgi:hypothetical protein